MTGSKTDFITTGITGERPAETAAEWQAHPMKSEIERLAYRLYESRGRRDGHDVDDRVLAEREITRHCSCEGAAESSGASEIAALSALRNGSTLRS
jgi:DUF2934 family protein